MAKAPLPENEEERLRALYGYDLLDRDVETIFDTIIRIAADICDVDICVIALIDRDRQFFLARKGMKPRETPRAIAFCAHAILEPHTIFEIPDATNDPRFHDNPLVTGEIGVRFYAAQPLTTPEGHALGGLCLIGKKPNLLNDVQRDTLRNLGNVIMTLFESRKTAFAAADRLIQAKEAAESALSRLQWTQDRLVEAQSDILRSERLAVLGKLSATVSHELRNPLGTIRASMITITNNTEGRGLAVEGAIGRIERNIERCDGIIGELLDYARDKLPNREPTDVDEWLGSVLDEQDVPPGLSLGRDLASGVEADIDRDRLRRAVINIFDNACQAVKENGGGVDQGVAVATRAAGERMEILVTDSGPGIPDDELGKVFEPLYSTKSFGIGLGLPVARKIAEEHGGGIDIASTIGRGTRAMLWLPLAAPEQGGNETS